MLTLMYKCSNAEDLKSVSVLLDSSGYITVKQAKSLRKACRWIVHTKVLRISKDKPNSQKFFEGSNCDFQRLNNEILKITQLAPFLWDLLYMYVSGFEKRSYFVQKMNFKLVVLYKTTLHDLTVALGLASQAASVTEICAFKVQENTENIFEKNTIKCYTSG